MFTRHRLISMWQLLVLASALLFGIGSSHSAFCQIFSGENGGITRSKRAPNPQINRLANKKQQAIEQAIEKGNKARDENNFGKALGHYQQALELNPREARAYYGLGNVYADVFCNASAIEAYHKAIKLKKNYLKALIGLADTYAVEERHDHAQEQYQKALALAPKNAEANLGLGVIHARKGRYQEAITQINLVINAQAIEDRATAHVVLGDVYSIELVNNHQKAIEQYQKAISLKPDLAIAYFALGNEQMNYAASRIDYSSPRPQEKLHTSMKQATDNIKRAIEYNLSHPGVHIFLGMALARQSLYQNAESEINIYFNKIKELESQLPSLALKCTSGFNMFKAIGYAGLGYVYFFEGTFEADEKQRAEFFSKAINQFNQAIKLKQDFVGAHLALALVYTLQGESEKAIEQYKKVILFAPINSYKAVGYEGIGFIYSKIDREALAVDYLQEAINLNPKRPSPYRWLAEIYVNQDKLKETIDLLKKSAQLEPETSATLYFDLGATYIGRCVKTANEEDFNEGIRLLKKAIEIKPNYADAYLAIGLAYLTRSKGDEALENAKKAAGYNPKDPQIYYLMAMVYHKLKHNDDEAIRLLKDAINLSPKFAELHWFLARVYYHNDNHSEGMEQMQKAIEIDPKLLKAYLDLAYMYKAHEYYPEAIKLLKTAIEIAPTDPNPYSLLAEVYEDQGTNEDAGRYYEQAANRLNADDSFNKNIYLGRAARLRGRYDEAISYFQKLVNMEPRDKAYYEMGLTYIASGSRSAALEQYQQLVQLKSSLAEELLEKTKEMK